jgi:hypothetical protein
MESADKLRKFGLFVTGNSEPVQTWQGDLIKLADKDKVEISKIDGYGGAGLVVAIVSLDKGQNVSEMTGSI